MIHAPRTIKWEIVFLRYFRHFFFFLILSKKTKFPTSKYETFCCNQFFALKIIRKLDRQDWMLERMIINVQSRARNSVMDWDDYCYYTSRLSIDNPLRLRLLEFYSRHEKTVVTFWIENNFLLNCRSYLWSIDIPSVQKLSMFDIKLRKNFNRTTQIRNRNYFNNPSYLI